MSANPLFPGVNPRQVWQIVHSVGVRAGQFLLAAVAAVIIARCLRPDGRGEVTVLVTIATTAFTLGHLSVAQAQVVLWRDARRAIPANALLLGPAVGVLAAAVTALVTVGLGDRLPVPGYGLL